MTGRFLHCSLTSNAAISQQKQKEGSETLLSISIYYSGFSVSLLSSVRLSFCLLAQFRLCLSACKLFLLAARNLICMLRERRYPGESTGTVSDACCTSGEIHEDAGLECVWDVWNRSNASQGQEFTIPQRNEKPRDGALRIMHTRHVSEIKWIICDRTLIRHVVHCQLSLPHLPGNTFTLTLLLMSAYSRIYRQKPAPPSTCFSCAQCTLEGCIVYVNSHWRKKCFAS